MKLFSQCLVSSITLGHHHLTELIKVHGSRTILIQFFNDSLQFLISERSKQLSNQSSQSLGGDEALTLLVVDPECVLQLLLHGLEVGILHQECGAQLAELPELDLAGPDQPEMRMGSRGQTRRSDWSAAHPSSSTSCRRSTSSSSVGLKPMARMISPRSSADRKSCFLVSNRSKQT